MPSDTPSSIAMAVQGQSHDRMESHHGVRLGEPDDLDTEVNISISMKMLSAVSGSLITSLLVTPLDVVRVRLQSQPNASAFTPRTGLPTPSTPYSFSNLPSNLGISACCREVFWVTNNTQYCVASPSVSVINNATGAPAIPCAAEETQRKTFTSTFDGLRKIARNEGPRTLWRGLSPTLVMAIPANVIYFAGYDWLRFNKSSPFRQAWISDTYVPLVAGSSARILAAIAVSPIEMFRTRMQAAQTTAPKGGNFRETLQGLKEMVGANGYRSLWTGLSLTLWRDVPFSAIYWWGYEYCRNALTDMHEQKRGRERITGNNVDAVRLRSRSRSQDDHTTTLIDSFIAGAASGAVAALVTTPFDVGKTRQQVVRHAAGSVASASKIPEELPMPRFLWHIFKQQGVSGLFRGWAARCLKVAPACAIMISSYEIGKKMAGAMEDKKMRRGV